MIGETENSMPGFILSTFRKFGAGQSAGIAQSERRESIARHSLALAGGYQ
jgi:hypothetical protein